MKLILTEEQEFLRDTAKILLKKEHQLLILDLLEIIMMKIFGIRIFGKKWSI